MANAQLGYQNDKMIETCNIIPTYDDSSLTGFSFFTSDELHKMKYAQYRKSFGYTYLTLLQLLFYNCNSTGLYLRIE